MMMGGSLLSLESASVHDVPMHTAWHARTNASAETTESNIATMTFESRITGAGAALAPHQALNRPLRLLGARWRVAGLAAPCSAHLHGHTIPCALPMLLLVHHRWSCGRARYDFRVQAPRSPYPRANAGCTADVRLPAQYSCTAAESFQISWKACFKLHCYTCGLGHVTVRSCRPARVPGSCRCDSSSSLRQAAA